MLFRGVVVKAGARVENSIVMQDTVIEEGAIVRNAIIDKNCVIRAEQMLVGDFEPVVLEKWMVV